MEKESVKLDSRIIEKVRENKEKTGIPIGKFIEMAITEKLLTLKKKK